MTVAELIAELEDLPEDAEVRLAIQPHCPLQFEVDGVVENDPTAEYKGDVPEEGRGPNEEVVVYILQGEHPRHDRPYAPEGLWTR